MKSSCIQHPTQDRLLIIREWQLTFCEGDHCAAALLSFLEYWHNIRLDMCQKAKAMNQTAEKHGDTGTQDESLFQFHTDEQLRAGLLGLYGTKKIRDARRLLIQKGVITEHANPNPRYVFDKTLFFLFHPEVVNTWLAQQGGALPPGSACPDSGTNHTTLSGKNAVPFGKNADGVDDNAVGDGKSADGVGKNAAYTEITTEITTETTSEITSEIVVDDSSAEASEPDIPISPSTTLSESNSGKVDTRKRKKTPRYPIPNDWQPSPACLARLEGNGIPRDFAMQLVDEFVLYWRGRNLCRPGWDSTFFNHAKHQWKRQRSKAPVSAATLDRGGVGNSRQNHHDYGGYHETNRRHNQPQRLSAAEEMRRAGLRFLAEEGDRDAQRELSRLEGDGDVVDADGGDLPPQMVIEIGPTREAQQCVPNVAQGALWNDFAADRQGDSPLYPLR